MMRVGRGEIFVPLLNLPLRSDLIRQKSCPCAAQLCDKLRIGFKHLGRLDAVAEQLANNGHIHGSGDARSGRLSVGRNEAQLWRDGGSRYEVPFTIFDEPVEAELCCSLHEGIGELT